MTAAEHRAEARRIERERLGYNADPMDDARERRAADDGGIYERGDR